MKLASKLKLLVLLSFLFCVFVTIPQTSVQAYYGSYGLGGLYSSLGSYGLYGGLYGGLSGGLYGSGLSGLYGSSYGLGLYGSSYGLGLYGGLSGGLYGGLYGGLSGGLYGSGLSGLYGSSYGLGLYGSSYGLGLYGGLSGLYGGLYGGLSGGLYGSGLSRLYGSSYGLGLYGSSYGLGLYGGGYGSGLFGGLYGLSSLAGLSSLTSPRLGFAEQAGLWQGIWSIGTLNGPMTLNLVEDPVIVGALSGYVQLVGNIVLPTLVSVTGENLNGQITLHGTNNLAGGKLVDIDILATLTSASEIDGEYTLTLPNLATVAETGAFQVIFTTPVI